MSLKSKKVSSIIERFETSPNQALPVLMEDAKVLSAQLYWYADLLGDVGKEYRFAYIKRKQLFSELTKKYMIDQSATAAKNSAECDPLHVEARKTEVTAETRYEKGKLMFKAIEHVIQRMNQEIAELRKERSYQKHLQ